MQNLTRLGVAAAGCLLSVGCGSAMAQFTPVTGTSSRTFCHKVEQEERKGRPHRAARYEDFASARFLAIAATIPTIDINPMDLPMESSRPKTW